MNVLDKAISVCDTNYTESNVKAGAKFYQNNGSYYKVDSVESGPKEDLVNFTFYGPSGKKQFDNSLYMRSFLSKINFSCK